MADLQHQRNSAQIMTRGLRGMKFNHMVGGQHVPVLCIYDYSRTFGADLTLYLFGQIKELAKQRIFVERVVFANPSLNGDVHYSRRHLANKWCERRNSTNTHVRHLSPVGCAEWTIADRRLNAMKKDIASLIESDAI